MKRLVLAAIAGFLVWSALWLLGNLGALGPLFPESTAAFGRAEPVTHGPYLFLALGLSIACSLLAGWLCARLARERSLAAVLTLGLLLLVTGIAVQLSAWALMPVWYHLSFLILILPACLLGRLFAPGPASQS